MPAMTTQLPIKLLLVSHSLCPYVQRAAIVLAEKHRRFERIDIDLANKPDWFLAISPLGKTPVLLVDGQPIFESAVICEYLDDTVLPPMHPQDALARAQHRGWMEFGSGVLNAIAGFYNAASEEALTAKAMDIHHKFVQLESVLTQGPQGPYFSGSSFSMVDAVFGPVFRYFDVFDKIGEFGFFAGTPKVSAWRAALAARPSVKAAARADYEELLMAFLIARRSAISARIASRL
jgi:glutathione S-transferase